VTLALPSSNTFIESIMIMQAHPPDFSLLWQLPSVKMVIDFSVESGKLAGMRMV
jgi:hypothetical protein